MMVKSFQTVEDVVADADFQAWYSRTSEEQVQAWENWLAENQSQAPLVQEAIELLAALKITEKEISDLEIKKSYDRLNSRLDALESNATPVVSIKRRKRWWLSVAAAVLLLIAGGIFWKVSQTKPSIEAQYGQVLTHQLPDGSTMMLNANSTARISKEWNPGKDREVWLKGEAFFKVKKTRQKDRFIVHTGQLDIIVTGTQFNVWTRNNKTSVLLTEGSVTIKTNDGKEILMKPGDFIEMQDNKAEKKVPNEESVLAWKESKLNFDNTPLKDAAIMISNHYGVTIKLADESIGEKPITGMMPNNNLDDLLKALEATNDFKITRTDKTILISTP